MQSKQTAALLIFLTMLLTACPSEIITVSGVVRDDTGPIPNAVVRIQTTDFETTTDDQGRFTLEVTHAGPGPFDLTAWAPGYFSGGLTQASPGDQNLVMMLEFHAQTDHPAYEWLSSGLVAGEGENQACRNCHGDFEGVLEYSLPYDEWVLDAHAQTATNHRFLTMYFGTDVSGHQSPPTRFGTNRDYGKFPLRPDLSQPYYGPGYRLDFPDSNGNCAACHLPAAAVDDPYGINPGSISGVATEGVPCDVCHKVWDVNLDNATGLPHPNRPGVLSIEFRRPEEGHQFFAGPFDDVAPGEDTYSPIQTESQFCAACHFGVFWDVTIYNSFGEWLESPYNDPQNGRTCQDCHMPPQGGTTFVLPERGGLERDPQTIFSHRMPGAADVDLLQNAVTLVASAAVENGVLEVIVEITNDLTGHHVPTDSPLRHVILLVEVTDTAGNSLQLIQGETVPEWCGIGDPNEGYYAGLPGKAFAKILQELWTEVAPSGAYWNPTRLVSDNRLAAFETDRSVYQFETGGEGPFTVEVRLLFRRAFIQLADWKGWEDEDILMESETLVVDL